MILPFLRAYPPAQPVEGPAIWVAFRNNELLLMAEGDRAAMLQGGPEVLGDLQAGPPLYLGTLNDVPCLACELAPEAALPEGLTSLGLRALFGRLDEPQYALAGYAAQLLYWERTSRFCPVCGHGTEPVAGDWGRRCTNCGHTRYPQVSPAILALVHDGDHVLLTHKPGWSKMYSIIAGFVEPGESLEECVHREVHEEVGVEVTDLAYVGSQPWPFPHQLMIGYTARYDGGDLRIDDKELDEAVWFHVDELPQLPGKLSLSRQIIDGWIESRGRRSAD